MLYVIMALLYGIMVLISAIVRQCFLPNPFECFGNYAFIINFIVEPFIHILSYNLVGRVYHRGEAPALGSFLYLLCYAAITGILALMGIFSFAWWWDLIIIAAVIAVIVVIKLIINKFLDSCRI